MSCAKRRILPFPFSVLHLLIALQAVQIPPAPRGYGTNAAEIVVDAAGVLPATSVDHINRIAFDVHQKSGGEMDAPRRMRQRRATCAGQRGWRPRAIANKRRGLEYVAAFRRKSFIWRRCIW